MPRNKGQRQGLPAQLKSSDAETRRSAAKRAGESAGHLEQKERATICSCLREVLLYDGWQPAREWAAWALGRIGKPRDEASVDALIDQVDTANPDLACFAAQALGEIRCERAVEPVAELLRKAEDILVRRFAADALGQLRGFEEARQVLEEVAADATQPQPVIHQARSALAGARLRSTPDSDTTPVQLQLDGIPDVKPTDKTQPSVLDRVTRRTVVTEVPERDRELAQTVKKERDFICQVCGREPFATRVGLYCEAHHIEELRGGGPDIRENILVVCPNCHKKLHHAKKVEFGYGQAANTRPSSVAINEEEHAIDWPG